MPHRLDPMLQPRAVAIVGASERVDSAGGVIMRQIKHAGFKGAVYPINPKRDSINGVKTYKDLDSLFDSLSRAPKLVNGELAKPELAILAIPNAAIEPELETVIRLGIKAVTIYSTLTMDELDLPPNAPPLMQRVKNRALAAGILICGANSMAFYNFANGLWVCPYSTRPDHRGGRDAPLGLITHSGSVYNSLLDADARLHFNFAVSTGQELTTTAADYLDYMLEQPGITAIGLVLETVRDPKGFISALEKAAQKRVAIIALKLGRTADSAALALSHSGALVGSFGAYRALFERYGVFIVESIAELASSLLLFQAASKTVTKRAGESSSIASDYSSITGDHSTKNSHSVEGQSRKTRTGESTATVSTSGESTATVSTSGVSNARVSTAGVSTSTVSYANESTLGVRNATASTSGESTATASTSDESTAGAGNSDKSNATVSTPGESTAGSGNSDKSNATASTSGESTAGSGNSDRSNATASTSGESTAGSGNLDRSNATVSNSGESTAGVPKFDKENTVTKTAALKAGGLAGILDSGGERVLFVDLASDYGVPFAKINAATTASIAARLEPGMLAVNPLDAWGTGRDNKDIYYGGFTDLATDPATAIAAIIGDRQYGGEAMGGVVDVFYNPLLESVRQKTDIPLALVSNHRGIGDDANNRYLSDQGFIVMDDVKLFLGATKQLMQHRDRPPFAAVEIPPELHQLAAKWRPILAAKKQLGEAEALAFLSEIGVPTNPCQFINSEAELSAISDKINYPMVLKTAVPGIVHKTEVRGVIIGINSENELRTAYRDMAQRLGSQAIIAPMVNTKDAVEMFIGISQDSQFGSIIIYGFGGIYAETIKDTVTGFPPLSTAMVTESLKSLRHYGMLTGARNRPSLAIDVFANAVARLSQFAFAFGEGFGDLDINPILLSEKNALALDGFLNQTITN